MDHDGKNGGVSLCVNNQLYFVLGVIVLVIVGYPHKIHNGSVR